MSGQYGQSNYKVIVEIFPSLIVRWKPSFLHVRSLLQYTIFRMFLKCVLVVIWFRRVAAYTRVRSWIHIILTKKIFFSKKNVVWNSDIDIIINEFAASKGRKLYLLWNVD